MTDKNSNRDDMNSGSNSGSNSRSNSGSNSGMSASGSNTGSDSNRDNRGGRVSQADSSQENRTDKLGKERVIGRGMSSPDSTEAVLDASTGEPDPRARGEGSLASGNERDRGMRDSSRTAEQESHLSSGKSGGKKS